MGEDEHAEPDYLNMPLADFLALEFYTLLCVKSDAPAAALRSAWRRLILQLHPDKGGHSLKFAYLKAVYDILSDPARRSEYDVHGRVAFESELPKMASEEPAGGPGVSIEYEILTELVNITALKRICEIKAMRHLRHGGVSYSQLAQYVISQCVNIEGGIGEYKVIWSANHRAARLGMIGRPVSGLRAAGFPIGSEYPPELASDPLVPHAFVGVSTFHMPGILSSSKTELRKKSYEHAGD